ncbi:hypothetical protein, partial [Salmonella sp. s54836]|uniref:hypothetical protein n=1 Tax=Salmonella sp. s54836 TaxID=3159673 RepID=UPI00397EAA0C
FNEDIPIKRQSQNPNLVSTQIDNEVSVTTEFQTDGLTRPDPPRKIKDRDDKNKKDILKSSDENNGELLNTSEKPSDVKP